MLIDLFALFDVFLLVKPVFCLNMVDKEKICKDLCLGKYLILV